MRKDQWTKLKGFLGYGRYSAELGRYTRESACPICGEKITEDCDGEGVTYSKTKAGGHLFIHEKCLKGGNGAKQ